MLKTANDADLVPTRITRRQILQGESGSRQKIIFAGEIRRAKSKRRVVVRYGGGGEMLKKDAPPGCARQNRSRLIRRDPTKTPARRRFGETRRFGLIDRIGIGAQLTRRNAQTGGGKAPPILSEIGRAHV